MRLRWPGLLPELHVGSPFPDVYLAENIVAYKAKPESFQTYVQRSASHQPGLLGLASLLLLGLLALAGYWCWRLAGWSVLRFSNFSAVTSDESGDREC